MLFIDGKVCIEKLHKEIVNHEELTCLDKLKTELERILGDYADRTYKYDEDILQIRPDGKIDGDSEFCLIARIDEKQNLYVEGIGTHSGGVIFTYNIKKDRFEKLNSSDVYKRYK